MIRSRRTKTPPKHPIVNGVMTYPDGRVVCQDTLPGRREYRDRLRKMIIRQRWECAICHRPIMIPSAEFDHQNGRGSGGGHRDDRIAIDGLFYNAALCHDCNTEKGSKRYEWRDGKYVPSKSPAGEQ